MKRTLAFAVVLLVSAAALAQQENVPTPRAPRLDDASVSENVYTNNFFGFRYTLPQGDGQLRAEGPVAPAAL